MTKADVISKIDTDLTNKAENANNEHEKHAFTVDRDQILVVVEAFFDVIKTSMESGQNVYMRGFGSFVNKKRARKKARLIKEKKSMVVEPHYIPSFKPAKVFMDSIKNSISLKEILKQEEEQEKKNA